MRMRLYVAGEGDTFRFATAKSALSAKRKLGKDIRNPSADDCRQVWLQGRIYELTSTQLRKQFGVSRQTAANWRHKGGEDLPTAAEYQAKSKITAIETALTQPAPASATSVAVSTKASVRLVRQYAEKLGVQFQPKRRMPSDEELIELQRDCTWQDLAIKTGLRLSSLRNYIYSNPQLSEALRAVRKPTLVGPAAHGTFPKEKVREMHLNGMSPHIIAETLHLEQMTVRYWIKKWQKEKSREKSANQRAADSVVGGSDAGDLRQ